MEVEVEVFVAGDQRRAPVVTNPSEKLGLRRNRTKVDCG